MYILFFIELTRRMESFGKANSSNSWSFCLHELGFWEAIREQMKGKFCRCRKEKKSRKIVEDLFFFCVWQIWEKRAKNIQVAQILQGHNPSWPSCHLTHMSRWPRSSYSSEIAGAQFFDDSVQIRGVVVFLIFFKEKKRIKRMPSSKHCPGNFGYCDCLPKSK